MTIKAILLDIEGTTAPISFVAEVLFPYAAERLAAFVTANEGDDEVKQALAETAELEGRALSTDEAIEVLLGWIAADRKATPLKTLQGKVWREGYESGVVRSPVYPDAVEWMQAWKARGLTLAVYSSGSVEAQKLLYGYTETGDLTPLFSGFFDTRTGAKTEAASYRAIAQALGAAPGEVLFLSDLPREIDAALAADMPAIRIDRTLPIGARSLDPGGTLVVADFAIVEDWLKAAPA